MYFLFEGLGLSGLKPIKPKSEKTLHVFQNWGPAYEVTLDFKINSWSYPGKYGSILHFSTGGVCCKPGQRVPGMWTSRDGRQILVSFDSINTFSLSHIELGVWYNIVIAKKTEQVKC